MIGRGGHSVPRRPAAVAVNPASDCRTEIDGLPPGPPTRLYDVQHLLRQRLVAPLPVNKPGYATPSEEAGPYHFNTADQYLQAHAVADPDLWAAKLAADQFVGADAIEYSANRDTFGFEALKFGSQAAAEDFHRVTLRSECATGTMTDVRTIPGTPGGLAYRYPAPGLPPPQASFVIGDTVVHVHICDCKDLPNLDRLTTSWAGEIALDMGANGH